MATIVAYIVGAAAVLTALGVIWKKAIKPAVLFTWTFVTTIQKMLPLMQELTEAFKDTPHAFEVLDEIIAEFRSDSGSTLRDVVNRIEVASEVNRVATEKAAAISDSLKVGVEAAKLLAGLDRDKLQDLILLTDRLGVRVDAGVATGLRNEQRAIGVADNLAAAQRRADETQSSEAGAAADAAASNPPEDK